MSDFDDSVSDGFEFEFPTDTSEIEVRFPIKDDDINENTEKFIISLELSSKAKNLKAELVTFKRSFAVCTIKDNDGELLKSLCV